MRLEILRLLEAALARPQDDGAREPRDAAREMDDASEPRWSHGESWENPWKTKTMEKAGKTHGK